MNIENKGSQKIKSKTKEVLKAFVSRGTMRADPMGSYTGKPIEKDQVPVQDADDL